MNPHKFKLTLDEPDDLFPIKIYENEFYTVTMTQIDDYTMIDIMPKPSSGNLMLKALDDRVIIHDFDAAYLRLDRVEKYKERLDIACKSGCELERLLGYRKD